MGRIGIVTEETADLPQQIIERNQIEIVPVILNWPELEGLPGYNTFQKMRELGKRGDTSFGKTAQPSPQDFLERYRSLFKQFDKVLCITITSKLSGSYNSAVLAKSIIEPEYQGKIHIVDSLNASCGQALVVLKAIDLIESGKEVEEIAKELQEFVPRVHVFAMFEDPKWLEASGRISHTVANLMRGMTKLGIRPVLTFKNGALVPAGLKIRAKDTADALFKQLQSDTKHLAESSHQIRVAITHGDNPDGAERLKGMIEKELVNSKVIFINIINNVVGAPTGPNTLALAWCEI